MFPSTRLREDRARSASPVTGARQVQLTSRNSRLRPGGPLRSHAVS